MQILMEVMQVSPGGHWSAYTLTPDISNRMMDRGEGTTVSRREVGTRTRLTMSLWFPAKVSSEGSKRRARMKVAPME